MLESNILAMLERLQLLKNFYFSYKDRQSMKKVTFVFKG